MDGALPCGHAIDGVASRSDSARRAIWDQVNNEGGFVGSIALPVQELLCIHCALQSTESGDGGSDILAFDVFWTGNEFDIDEILARKGEHVAHVFLFAVARQIAQMDGRRRAYIEDGLGFAGGEEAVLVAKLAYGRR